MAKKKREKKREIVVHSQPMQVIRIPYQMFDNLNPIKDDAGNEYPLCYANVEMYSEREAALQFIFTNPRYRRKGWAEKLLKHIQYSGRFDKIITGLTYTASAGQKLCKKCGFRKDGNMLVWAKMTPEEQKRFMKEYDKKHCVCPKCYSDELCHTTMAPPFDPWNPDKYVDTNDATCSCGWKGIVHKLLPEEEKNERSPSNGAGKDGDAGTGTETATSTDSGGSPESGGERVEPNHGNIINGTSKLGRGSSGGGVTGEGTGPKVA